MEIKTLVMGHIHTNCYLVSTDKTALVIDPAFVSKETEDFLLQNSDKERIILLTHAHFDHIGGAPVLRENTGVKIGVGELDNADLADPFANLSDRFHAHIPPFGADITFKDGDEITVGDVSIKVLHTPGHTEGSVCYQIGDILFSGDTLFYESIGRTDFPKSNHFDMLKSLQRLLSLEGITRVLPGHGPETDIQHERLYNPFI